jgi:hypothetical protein
MQPILPARSFLAVFGVVTMLGAAALAQPAPEAKKYLLKEASAAVGDVSVLDQSSNLQMEVFGTPRDIPGATPRSFELVQRRREKFTETVLAVGKDGVTQVRRVYTISRRQEKSGPEAALKTTVSSCQGKTVTIKKVAGKTLVTAAKGKLTPADIKELKERFEQDSDFNMFPMHEVGPGDEWAVDEAVIKRKFGVEHASLQAKFVEVVPFKGHPSARIAITMHMEGKAGPNPLSWDMEGEFHFALDLQRTLSGKLHGPVNTKGAVESGGITVDVEGLGEGAFNHSQQWLKVAGKPVPVTK